LSGLAPVVIQKYLKTILDNGSRSQYCSLRQEELPSIQSALSAPLEVQASDVI
jgi:hypothetical protein